MDDLTGKTLGRYQVLNMVGRGGMATVYQAKDPGLNRTVALKLLHPHLAADPTFVARFRREAQAVAALRHPNIVQVYDFDSSEGLYFMVMEFIDGPTLATMLDRLSRAHHRLSPVEVLRIFPPLCSAIDYANGEGMVHRDIKPSNIMLTRKGDPVLADYGIARIAGSISYTLPGTVVGSAQYMSPEQAQGQPADNRSDIYSLGVCLFEALTGRVPFDGETTATILAQHLTAPIPAARALNPDLPPEMEAVLQRVLAKDPAARYQEAAELARDLGEASRPSIAPVGATAVEPALAAPSVPPIPAAPPAPPSLGRRPVILIVVAFVAVACVATFLVLRPEGGTVVSTTGVGDSTTAGSGSTATTTAADAAALTAADSLVDEGRILEAVAKYQAIVATNPKNDAAQTRLGIAYALMSDTKEEGERQLVSATVANSSNAEAWTFLGMVRFDLAERRNVTDYAAAKEALKKALELDPDNARAHAFQAQIYAAEDRLDEALVEANMAVGTAPDDAYTLSSLGYVHAMREEWHLAVAQYEKAVGVQPNWAWLQGLLAEGLQYTETYPEALAAAETSLKLGQGYEARAYRRMGHIYWDEGDSAQAEIAFQKSLQLDKTDDYAQWGLGGVWYERGDYQNALNHLIAAATLSPNDAGYQAWLGACYEALNMFPEARAALEKALRLDPERTDAKEILDQMTAEGH